MTSRKDLDFEYCCPADFVMKHGRWWEGQKRPKRHKKDKPRYCYDNAGKLATASQLHYVEGYYVTENIMMPLQHAWCVDDVGMVVDTTYRYPWRAVYFGVKFKLTYVLQQTLDNGYYGIFGECYRFPLLTGEHRTGDAIWTDSEEDKSSNQKEMN